MYIHNCLIKILIIVDNTLLIRETINCDYGLFLNITKQGFYKSWKICLLFSDSLSPQF